MPTGYALHCDCPRPSSNRSDLHHSQGYELTEDEINISLDEFRSQYGDDTGGPARAKMAFTARPSEQMLKRYTPITRPGEEPREPEIGLIHVEFSPDPNVGIKQLKQFAQLLDEKKYFTGTILMKKQLLKHA